MGTVRRGAGRRVVGDADRRSPVTARLAWVAYAVTLGVLSAGVVVFVFAPYWFGYATFPAGRP